MHGNVNAANVAARARPGRRLHRALRAAQHLRRRRLDHAGDADYVAFTQRDSSQQKIWDFSANLTGGLFDLPGGTAGIAIGLEHRDLSGRFDPDAIVAAGLGSDIPGPADRAAATMSTRPMPNCGCPCSRTGRSSTASS